MNRREKRELDRLKKQDLDVSLAQYKAEEALAEEKPAEVKSVISGTSISTVRLRNLTELVEKYDQVYRNISVAASKDREAILEEVMSIYIPNVLNDITGVLSRMEVMTNYIKFLELKNNTLKKQNEKAYTYLKWTVNKFHDPAEALPDNPEDLGDVDPRDIIVNQKRKVGIKRSTKKKTKAKPKSKTAEQVTD
jgi:hypothetical protein